MSHKENDIFYERIQEDIKDIIILNGQKEYGRIVEPCEKLVKKLTDYVANIHFGYIK